MQRPMFQTPQQRQGMGIMAGVAPVRGYKDGGEAEEIAVTAESPEELDIKLFGEGGVLFDTDSPISSTLMALTIPLGGGAIALTARGLMAARKAAQVAKAAKAASKVDDPSQAAVARSLGVADDIAVGAPKPPLPPPSMAARAAGIPAAAAGAIRRNPGKTALAGIAAGGASTIPFGGGEPTEAPADTSTGDTGGGGDTGDQQSGIMKFLFGADGIGGEPGAVGKVGEKLRDPRTQYALAKAAAPSEGRTPRNFLSDLTLAGAEYDAIQQQSQTAFMRNFEALREIYPDDVTDEEVAQLALGDSDDPQQTFLTLFGKRLEGTIPPTPSEIAGLAALSGYDLSEEELKQITAMQAKPEATLS